MVVDSHVLYWWLEAKELLSSRALRLVNQAGSQQLQIYHCGVSLWELHRKELIGSLAPRVSICRWPDLLACLPWLLVLPTRSSDWLGTASLDWVHRDPADRIIAATAKNLGMPVLTKDRVFHRPDSPTEGIW